MSRHIRVNHTDIGEVPVPPPLFGGTHGKTRVRWQNLVASQISNKCVKKWVQIANFSFILQKKGVGSCYYYITIETYNFSSYQSRKNKIQAKLYHLIQPTLSFAINLPFLYSRQKDILFWKYQLLLDIFHHYTDIVISAK